MLFSRSSTSTMVGAPERRFSSTIHLFFGFRSFSSRSQTGLRLGACLGPLVDLFAFSAGSPQI